MNTATHTPTPWRVQDSMGDLRVVCDAPRKRDLLRIALVAPAETIDETAANAAFIVLAVNAHDELVAALRDLVQISEIAVGFGVMREDANGPLPTAQRLLAKLDGAA